MISYKKLFKLLIDKEMSKKELAEKAGLSAYTITKINKGEVVKSDTLAKICKTLDCTFDDIMEITIKNRGQ
jgi:DNA-binding Xre family transcriptional regulator